MLALAAEAPPGALGLTFLPYLTGERTPHADPRARGAIVGLTLSHDQRHLLRAVVEGITFGLRDCLDLLRRSGESAAHVRVSGGGARSAWWRQVMADVFDADVATINVSEGAAFGAALLAAVGGGAYRTVDEAASAIVRERTITHPGRPAVSSYEAPYARYRALYPILAATWRQGAAP